MLEAKQSLSSLWILESSKMSTTEHKGENEKEKGKKEDRNSKCKLTSKIFLCISKYINIPIFTVKRNINLKR